jgi:small-conductance mechanosensitive channel
VAQYPEPGIFFCGFGDSSLDFELRCWIDDPSIRESIFDSLNRHIYKALGAAGIEIPFPKRDVYIKELPDSLLRRET